MGLLLRKLIASFFQRFVNAHFKIPTKYLGRANQYREVISLEMGFQDDLILNVQLVNIAYHLKALGPEILNHESWHHFGKVSLRLSR